MSDKKLTKKNISDALHELGQATSVDRVYIFEHLVGSNGSRGFMSQRYEWSRDNVQPQIDNPSLQNVPWDDMAPRWYDTFMSGGIISGNVIDFPQEERKVLDPQKIISILVLPIHVNNVFWGFIGFDDCSKEREWSTSEVGLLRSTANSFAVVIERMRAETITMVQIEQSEKMNSLMVGRELKMIELKNEIIALKKSREQ